MLAQLTVENFALLKHVDLFFDSKFNVLSGETGAGKSIIIDAVKLILGERANVSDIRYKEDCALVEAVFILRENHAVFKTMDQLGLEYDNQTIILTRQVKSNGHNLCRVNRKAVTLAQFKSVCSQLVSIYGQHDYDDLADSAVRLSLLDGIGDMNHQTLRERVSIAYNQAQKSGRDLKRALRENAKLKTEIDELKKNVEELSSLSLYKGEEEDLNRAHKQITHSQDLYDAVYLASGILYEQQGNIHELLTDALDALKRVVIYDKKLEPYCKDLSTALIVVDDTTRELDRYREQIDFDSNKLEKLNQRLTLFSKLQKKYQKDIDELVDVLPAWKEKVNAYENADTKIDVLQKQYQKDRRAYIELANELHNNRIEIGKVFSEKLISELSDMEMQEVKFEVELENFSGDCTGTDVATFMIAPNRGMPLRPLYDISSGGEMSRIMLAIKKILGSSNGVETLIFDEIDTGIGGMVLTSVADKLEELGQHEQVICVTHAPSIAARGDKNFFISKEVINEMTETHVVELTNEDEVLHEIARMSGGHDMWQIENAKCQRDKKIYRKKAIDD